MPNDQNNDPTNKKTGLRQSLYNGYGFGGDPEQRGWALQQGGAIRMIQSANEDYAREQAKKAGAFKKSAFYGT